MKYSTIMLAVLALSTCPAVADDLASTTAEGLANECRVLVRFENDERLKSRERTGLMFCLGYFSGAFETLTETMQTLSCVPGSVDVGQRIRIFLSWADRNPALLHIHRATAVQLALVEAFPCTASDAGSGDGGAQDGHQSPAR